MPIHVTSSSLPKLAEVRGSSIYMFDGQLICDCWPSAETRRYNYCLHVHEYLDGYVPVSTWHAVLDLNCATRIDLPIAAGLVDIPTKITYIAEAEVWVFEDSPVDDLFGIQPFLNGMPGDARTVASLTDEDSVSQYLNLIEAYYLDNGVYDLCVHRLEDLKSLPCKNPRHTSSDNAHVLAQIRRDVAIEAIALANTYTLINYGVCENCYWFKRNATSRAFAPPRL